MKFIGREKELDFLTEKYNSSNREFILVYGRRRLGKTYLLKKSIENTQNSLYFLCTKDSIETNLKKFKETLSNHLQKPIINTINSQSFEEFFSYVIEYIPKNFVFIFDEIPFLISQKKEFLSHFQKIYDEYFSFKNTKLVFCGSSLSIMNDINNYTSPLYGRRTGKIHLTPFTISQTLEYFNQKTSIEEIFKYQLLFGGVPYYFSFINQKKSFKENIISLFFSQTSIFDDEISFLLREEFKEIRTYHSILRAISQSKNTLTQISQEVGIQRTTLSKYLFSLEAVGLIMTQKNIFDKKNSKKTRYILSDNFIYLWFSVFEKYKQTNYDITKIITTILDDINRNFGHLFEKECRRILSKQSLEIGTFFNSKGVEIDIVSKRLDSSYELFECKFSKKHSEEKIIEQLEYKKEFLPLTITIHATHLISINQGITLEDLLNIDKGKY